AALVRLDPKATQALSLLIERLKDPAGYVDCTEPLTRLGAEAVPALVVVLEDTTLAEPEETPERIRGRPARRAGFGARGRAVEVLGAIGPRVKGVLPALIKALDNEDVQQAAVYALAGMGDELPRLAMLRALEATSFNTRAGAAMVLCTRKDDRDRAVAVLLEAMGKGNDGLRIRAARALVQQRIATPAVLDALTKGLAKDTDPRAEEFATLLGQLGPAARPAAAALTAALKSPNKSVRLEAAIALSKIDPRVVAAVPVPLEAVREQGVGLGSRLGSGRPGTTQRRISLHAPHAEALLQYGTPAVEGLAALFADRTLKAPGRGRPPRGGRGGGGFPGGRGVAPGDDPRAAIAGLLAEFGEEARAAVPALKDGLKDPTAAV